MRPAVVRRARRLAGRVLRRLQGGPAAAHGEKPQSFYDDAFEHVESYHVHYTRSEYYAVWTVVIDRIRRAGSKRVLDIGCGPGQFAHALFDADLVEAYHGVDLSRVGVERAQRNVPAFTFEHCDIFASKALETQRYDTLVTTEFLEHVERELDVLERIPAGTRVIATVPNFPYVSHVRHFADVAAVQARYGRFFEGLTVDPIRKTERGNILFLMEGVRAG